MDVTSEVQLDYITQSHRSFPLGSYILESLIGINNVYPLDYPILIINFVMLEQGKFLSEKHRNEAGAEVGAFIGRFL